MFSYNTVFGSSAQCLTLGMCSPGSPTAGNAVLHFLSALARGQDETSYEREGVEGIHQSLALVSSLSSGKEQRRNPNEAEGLFILVLSSVFGGNPY